MNSPLMSSIIERNALLGCLSRILWAVIWLYMQGVGWGGKVMGEAGY